MVRVLHRARQTPCWQAGGKAQP